MARASMSAYQKDVISNGAAVAETRNQQQVPHANAVAKSAIQPFQHQSRTTAGTGNNHFLNILSLEEIGDQKPKI